MKNRSVQILSLGWICLIFSILSPLQGFQSSRAKYDGIVKVMAREYRIPAELIHSIIKVESDYNPRAVSHKGAMGLMQLMPATAKQYDVEDVFDPLENIEGGVKYLRELMQLYDRNTNLVLAAYNAGQSAVAKYGGIPPYRETIDYIDKIKRNGYRKSIIISGSEIYRYVDDKGHTVLTNDYLAYKQHLAKRKKK
ncbi:MAG: lytic transglycosylase domain-containing protein [Candidatus Aminicenantaceae bacterium]